ncbi:MAG: hypothetical protein WAK91_15295 [Candidatus Acidiferrales bacterium]|jgi:hypothetical protein
MATTFLKRQKEMKRLEKQREKAERRAQKKLAGRAGTDESIENLNPLDSETPDIDTVVPSEPEHQI